MFRKLLLSLIAIAMTTAVARADSIRTVDVNQVSRQFYPVQVSELGTLVMFPDEVVEYDLEGDKVLYEIVFNANSAQSRRHLVIRLKGNQRMRSLSGTRWNTAISTGRANLTVHTRSGLTLLDLYAAKLGNSTRVVQITESKPLAMLGGKSGQPTRPFPTAPAEKLARITLVFDDGTQMNGQKLLDLEGALWKDANLRKRLVSLIGSLVNAADPDRAVSDGLKASGFSLSKLQSLARFHGVIAAQKEPHAELSTPVEQTAPTDLKNGSLPVGDEP